MNSCTKLRKIRKDIGLTQTEFAQMLGITQNHLSYIEKGERNVTIEIAKTIASVFDISLDWLLMDKGEAPTRIHLIQNYELSTEKNI